MSKSVTVVGGNLFRVAAEQLGDATQWIRIAQANGLSDPFLEGIVELVIPPVDKAATGGVPTSI